VASLTTRESISAANPQPRRLRHASFGLVILLVIQYVLGLSYNLYGTMPATSKKITEFSSPLLAVHVINGTLLILAAIYLVVAAVRARIRLAIITSGIGLLSVLAAFEGGEEFIQNGASGYSMLMGVMMAVALLCYVVNVWAFGGRGSE
jgi:hypothetical protein